MEVEVFVGVELLVAVPVFVDVEVLVGLLVRVGVPVTVFVLAGVAVLVGRLGDEGLWLFAQEGSKATLPSTTPTARIILQRFI